MLSYQPRASNSCINSDNFYNLSAKFCFLARSGLQPPFRLRIRFWQNLFTFFVFDRAMGCAGPRLLRPYLYCTWPASRVWQPSTSATGHTTYRNSLTLEGHGHSERCTAHHAPSDTLATGGDDHRVRIWTLSVGEKRHTLRGHSSPVTALAIPADGSVVVSGGAPTFPFPSHPSIPCYPLYPYSSSVSLSRLPPGAPQNPFLSSADSLCAVSGCLCATSNEPLYLQPP